MSDPLSQLRDVSALDCPSVYDLASELEQPFDDVPDYDANANPEINTTLRLSSDKRHTRTPTRRLYADYRAHPDAYKHLEPVPAEGESLHGVISGKYALWDLVPALIEHHKGQKIMELYLATLGFSRQNGAELCGLLDDGHVSRATLVPSHYFKSTSAPIYDAVVPELLARGQRVWAIRNHAKIILMRFDSGEHYTAESSANLRSCVNIEQFVLTRCPSLYRFHRTWIEEEIGNAMAKQKKHGSKDEQPDAAG